MTATTYRRRRTAPLLLGLAMALAIASCGPNRQKAMALADEAQQQLDAGDLQGAALTIDKAIREQEDVADLYLLKARIAAARQRPVEVLQSFQQAVDLEPGNVDALRGLAQFSFQLGRTDDAEKAVSQLLQQAPADPTGRLVKGLIALYRCRPETALALAGDILKNNAADEGGLVLKTRALFALRRDGEARATLDEATQRLGSTFSVLLTRLEMDRILADPVALRADFEAVRRLQPRSPDLALQQLNFLYKTGDFAGARLAGAALVKPGALEGDDLDRLARVWREYDTSPLGPGDLATLQARGSRPARIMAAQHYLEVGQAQPALALLNGLDGSDVAGLVARAQILLGRGGDAEAGARAVLARDKTQCEALLAVATLRLAGGQRDQAAARADESAAECPRQWLAYVVALDANAGSVPQMDRVTAAALDAEPQNGALARALAQRWAARGQVERGVAIARRVTRSAPALVSGWTLLQDMCRRSADAACAAEASRGLERARKIFTIDPLAGQQPPIGGGAIGCRGQDAKVESAPGEDSSGAVT